MNKDNNKSLIINIGNAANNIISNLKLDARGEVIHMETPKPTFNWPTFIQSKCSICCANMTEVQILMRECHVRGIDINQVMYINFANYISFIFYVKDNALYTLAEKKLVPIIDDNTSNIIRSNKYTMDEVIYEQSKLTLDKFLQDGVYVHCETKAQFDSILEICESNDIETNEESWDTYGKNTLCTIDDDDELNIEGLQYNYFDSDIYKFNNDIITEFVNSLPKYSTNFTWKKFTSKDGNAIHCPTKDNLKDIIIECGKRGILILCSRETFDGEYDEKTCVVFHLTGAGYRSIILSRYNNINKDCDLYAFHEHMLPCNNATREIDLRNNFSIYGALKDIHDGIRSKITSLKTDELTEYTVTSRIPLTLLNMENISVGMKAQIKKDILEMSKAEYTELVENYLFLSIYSNIDTFLTNYRSIKLYLTKIVLFLVIDCNLSMEYLEDSHILNEAVKIFQSNEVMRVIAAYNTVVASNDEHPIVGDIGTCKTIEEYTDFLCDYTVKNLNTDKDGITKLSYKGEDVSIKDLYKYLLAEVLYSSYKRD